MLKISNLCVNAGTKEILKDFNLNIDNDEIHVIMGPNGVGKSTICKVIMRDLDYTIKKGNIYFFDKDIKNMETNEISKAGIFYLAQNPTEVPGVKVSEMLRYAEKEREIEESIFDFNKKLTYACNELKLPKDFLHRDINVGMSGGEKKKNEMLGIYVLNPKLILLDELDSGLDVDALKTISLALLKYKETSHCSILIITHHTNILKYIKPDKVHIMDSGKIVKTGNIELAKEIEKDGFNQK